MGTSLCPWVCQPMSEIKPSPTTSISGRMVVFSTSKARLTMAQTSIRTPFAFSSLAEPGQQD
ncbi:MAG: hypothetical protein AB2637_14310 [Candidatus Thiodiazotropha sp.]|nr:hypothetical protein [Candidatus Thiodiazotropha sp. (ex Lucina pensylvanica)]